MGTYSRLLRVWETGYGRSDGWIVEQRGQPIALLTDPKYADMFWVSYRIQAITPDPGLATAVVTEDFWSTYDIGGLAWRSRALNETIDNAIWACPALDEMGRIKMRGLYIDTRPPRPWDSVVLFARRWLKKDSSVVTP